MREASSARPPSRGGISRLITHRWPCGRKLCPRTWALSPSPDLEQPPILLAIKQGVCKESVFAGRDAQGPDGFECVVRLVLATSVCGVGWGVCEERRALNKGPSACQAVSSCSFAFTVLHSFLVCCSLLLDARTHLSWFYFTYLFDTRTETAIPHV